MRLSVLLALLPAVLGAPTKRSEPAPLLVPRGDANTLIADKYIVKFKDDSSLSILESAVSILSEAPEHVYENTIRGFSATLDAETLEALRDHPDVDYIEQDAVVQLEAYVSQTGAPWGLARLSSRANGGSTYTYDNSAGTGTCSYIVDTGIDTTHSNFGGRASWAGNVVDSSNTDGNGHGTHVAGTVGSTTYGVAKNTKLFAVKVLNSSGSGTLAGVIAGIDLVPQHAAGQSCPNGVFGNMSLGASFSSTVNDATTRAIAAGVFFAVAAGNSNANAANYSPASTPNACTVGATTSADARASFSNYGAVVDIFAPGNAILSTWPGGGTNSISGTSMASPHIAGLGAYIAALEGNPGPVALCSRLVALSTTGVLSGIPSGTSNRLAFNGNPSG